MQHEQMIKPMLVGVGVLFVLGLAGLPVLDYLPLLLLLACPLMMITMMAGMSQGDGQLAGLAPSTCSLVEGHEEHIPGRQRGAGASQGNVVSFNQALGAAGLGAPAEAPAGQVTAPAKPTAAVAEAPTGEIAAAAAKPTAAVAEAPTGRPSSSCTAIAPSSCRGLSTPTGEPSWRRPWPERMPRSPRRRTPREGPSCRSNGSPSSTGASPPCGSSTPWPSSTPKVATG